MTDEKIMSTIKPDGEYWQPEIETMPREQLRQLQVKKLKETINVCLKSPFYKKRLGEVGPLTEMLEIPGVSDYIAPPKTGFVEPVRHMHDA